MPVLNKFSKFEIFIKQNFNGKKYIAHCYDTEKELLSKIYDTKDDILILIGPEGDFSEEEVNLALMNGFTPISLGKSRLRTETAGVVACNTISILNQ